MAGMTKGSLPVGLFRHPPVQPLLQKYFGSLSTQITCLFPVIPHPQEGRIAIVTDVGRGDAMDAGGALTKALIPADGEAVWS
jgi:hypothetical protein